MEVSLSAGVFPMLLFLGFINSLCFAQSTIHLGNETDRMTILAFKGNIINDPNGVLSSWNNSLHFCMWSGVTCSRRHPQRVQTLHLTLQSLRGHLSPHIGNLSFLRAINLSGNNLEGSIPQEIEYGTGANPSTYGDVYSYGILLLEMVTGKRPSDDMFKDDLGLHQFAKMALPESVMDIVDHRLLSEEIEIIGHNRNNNRVSNMIHECLVSLVKIGVSCSAESPKARKEMKDVNTELQKVRDFYLAATVARNV